MSNLKKVKTTPELTKKQNIKKEYKKPIKKEFEVAKWSLKPEAIVPKKTNTIVAWLVFGFTLMIYILTQARTMSFWDSGEFATCISILGVPHPPGSPFYIVFGRALAAIFGFIFSHAVISAFISGLVSAFAVMFTYLFTVKLVSMLKVKAFDAIIAGVVAAFYTAFSFTFWMNAIEAEVYSGLVFFINFILWLTMVWVQKSEDYDHQNILLFIVYLFFLGFCVHQTALQIAPAVLFIVSYPLLLNGVKQNSFWPKVLGYTLLVFFTYLIFDRIGVSTGIDEMDKWGFALVTIIIVAYELREVFGLKFWSLSVLLVLLGMSSHLYLLVRASARPFINEGHPSTLPAFLDYVLRKQYGNTNFMIRRANFFSEQMGFHFIRYFNMQWFPKELLQSVIKSGAAFWATLVNLIGFVLGAIGGFFQFKRNRHSFAYFVSVLFMTTIAMVFVMNLSNMEVRDRDYFFVTAYNIWAVWLGIGSIALLQFVQKKEFRYVLAGLLVLIPLLNMGLQYRVHDRSKEFIALDYGLNFLNSLEENAIIFTNGDNDTFPLWYAQAVADPYCRENLYTATDVMPSSEHQKAIAEAMIYKNKSLKGIRKDVSVANLSLLNTPWYIRQLRDKEGIYFSISDAQIDGLTRSYRTPYRSLKVTGTEASGSFELPLEESPSWRKQEQYYRPSDLAVMQIIKDNFGHRPIYFAVTCESFIGFDDFLRNEGMVSRLVSTKSDKDEINIVRLLKNIDEIYQYRSIEDDRVHKDENMNRLILNYGSGFIKAAEHYVSIDEMDKAWQYLDKARVFIDTEIRLTQFNTLYYSKAGKWDELEDFCRRVIFTHPEGWQIYLSYVLAHLSENYPQHTLPFVEMAMLQYPSQYLFANFALYFGNDYDKEQEVRAFFVKMRPHVLYDLNPYIDAIDNRK